MRRWISALVVVGCCVTSAVRAQDVRGKQLQIVEGVSGVDPVTDYIKIRGEIWNRSGGWIEAPRVVVELFDAAGKPIKVSGFLAEVKRERGADPRDGQMAERYFVPPGEVAVFEYLRDPAKLGKPYGSHKISAVASSMKATGPQMAVEGLQTSVDESGYYTVSGIIHNTGSVDCRSPKAVLGFYGPDGKVIHATYEEPDETFQKTLAPGGTVKFVRRSITDAKGAKDVKAWGDCSSPE